MSKTKLDIVGPDQTFRVHPVIPTCGKRTKKPPVSKQYDIIITALFISTEYVNMRVQIPIFNDRRRRRRRGSKSPIYLAADERGV